MNEDEAFEILQGALPETLVTNYVLVFETLDEYGSELHVVVSEGTTPWLASGMVDSAQDIIHMGQVSYAGSPNEEDIEDDDE